jgi:uracil-DNA glycosylase
VATVTTDEIYERYLRKAITEINRLSHEIAQEADGAPTALPTGHPLANIFLLKFGAQAQELQEGVAFHGRAGSALIKSLQRLHVDPLEVYGTNCVKFAGADLELSRAWLARELRIVEPKLLVVMGEDALEFLNGLEFTFARQLGRTGRCGASRRRSRHSSFPTSTRRSTTRRQDRLLERLQVCRAVVRRAAALPRSSRSFSSTTRWRCTSGTRACGGTSRGSASC